MLRLIALVLFTWLPVGVSAQYWATKDACDLTDPSIDWDSFGGLSQAQALAEANAIPNGVGRLWRIEGGDAPSYLWGTLHSNDPLLLALPDELTDAIERARLIALEIDPIAKSRRAFEFRHEDLRGFRHVRSTFSLDDSGLDPALVEVIRERLQGLGWGREAADFLTYGLLVEILLTHPCDDFASGVLPIQDGRIQMLGMIAGADILGMEPVDRLMVHLNRADRQDLALAHIEVLANYLLMAKHGDGDASGIAAYLSGQIGLWQVLDRAVLSATLGPERGPRLLDQMDGYLLDERNHDFMVALQDELPKGGVVIAVGAFHLPGEEGMVTLLRHAGYNVTRVAVEGEVAQ